MNSSALPALLTLLTLGVRRYFIVEQGRAKIVVRFGKPKYVAEPGLHWCLSLWGLVDRVDGAPSEEKPSLVAEIDLSNVGAIVPDFNG
jgi:regulator of protease activity HflC (stomatin/prohibitin superfamily)